MFETNGERETQPVAKFFRNRFVATAITVALGAFLAFFGAKTVWSIFGAANQMLAALALLAVTVWLAARGKKRLYTLIPMVLMFAITLSALGYKIYQYLFVESNLTLLVVAGILLILSIVLVALSAKSLRTKPDLRDA